MGSPSNNYILEKFLQKLSQKSQTLSQPFAFGEKRGEKGKRKTHFDSSDEEPLNDTLTIEKYINNERYFKFANSQTKKPLNSFSSASAPESDRGTSKLDEFLNVFNDSILSNTKGEITNSAQTADSIVNNFSANQSFEEDKIAEKNAKRAESESTIEILDEKNEVVKPLSFKEESDAEIISTDSERVKITSSRKFKRLSSKKLSEKCSNIFQKSKKKRLKKFVKNSKCNTVNRLDDFLKQISQKSGDKLSFNENFQDNSVQTNDRHVKNSQSKVCQYFKKSKNKNLEIKLKKIYGSSSSDNVESKSLDTNVHATTKWKCSKVTEKMPENNREVKLSQPVNEKSSKEKKTEFLSTSRKFDIISGKQNQGHTNNYYNACKYEASYNINNFQESVNKTSDFGLMMKSFSNFFDGSKTDDANKVQDGQQINSTEKQESSGYLKKSPTAISKMTQRNLISSEGFHESMSYETPSQKYNETQIFNSQKISEITVKPCQNSCDFLKGFDNRKSNFTGKTTDRVKGNYTGILDRGDVEAKYSTQRDANLTTQASKEFIIENNSDPFVFSVELEPAGRDGVTSDIMDNEERFDNNNVEFIQNCKVVAEVSSTNINESNLLLSSHNFQTKENISHLTLEKLCKINETNMPHLQNENSKSQNSSISKRNKTNILYGRKSRSKSKNKQSRQENPIDQLGEEKQENKLITEPQKHSIYNVTENNVLFHDNLLKELLEEKSQILKTNEPEPSKIHDEGAEVLAKTYIKKYKKGNVKIFKIKKRLKVSRDPYQPPEDQIMDKFIKNLDNNFQEQHVPNDDCESIDTPPSYITDDGISDVLSTGSSELPQHQKLLREGINKLSKDTSLLFSRYSDSVPDDADSFEVLLRIRKIINEILVDYEKGEIPYFMITKDGISNCRFKDGRYQRKEFPYYTKVKFRFHSLGTRFNLILLLLNKIRLLLEMGVKLTKREIYYQLKHLVASQAITDRCIRDISRMLNVGMWALNVTAQKGLIYGNLKLVMSNGETINCNVASTLIPKDVSEICEIHSDAFFILVVEKESIFQKLLEENLPNRLTRPFILITGKGFPDLNTQLLLKKLWMVMTIPVFILVDADPDGIAIMLNYRFGSVANAHVSEHLAIPKARWLGVFPSEILKLTLNYELMSKFEIKKTRKLLELQCVTENEKIKEEIEALLDLGLKSGIEGLMKTETYLSHRYLTSKLYSNDLI